MPTFRSTPSPFLFDTLASALEYIFRQELHYLDDFLIVGPPHSHICNDTFSGVEALCKHLGVTLKPDKLTPPTTVLTFLGVQLDTVAQVASLPKEKLDMILVVLQNFSTLQKCTKQALLSLIGKLSFAAKVIPAGRIFIRRLIDASMTASSNHHHVRISATVRADINWWLSFARNWNGRNLILEHQWTPSPAFQLFTDASDHGYGAYWRGHWFCSTWSKQQRRHTIQWRELFAVVLAAATWGSQWQRKRLLVHCDNHAVVHIWRTGTSKQQSLMRLVRTLFFTAATHNFTLILQHIQGIDNGIADALSRSQLHRFRCLAPMADQDPVPIPVVRMCD